jgi:hypothetical protein
MADEMENEFMKRGYLLPKGCKDLSDLLKSEAEAGSCTPKHPAPGPLPPITGEMSVPPSMTVGELAETLSQKPFQTIADLMEIGIFAQVSQKLEFHVISKVLRKNGYVAKKAA